MSPGASRAAGAGGGAAVPPELLDTLLTHTADAVYLVDREGLVRFVNPAALAVLGYDTAGELLGAPSHATIHAVRPDGSPFPEQECPLLLPRTSGETVWVEEDWFVRRDGTLVPVAYSSAPLPQPDGRGAVVVFRETTERRAAEQARRREAEERARGEELRASRARIVAAADAERRRLGRDIHDGAQQRLLHAALGVGESVAELERGGDRGAVAARLRDVIAELRGTLTDLRELSAGIHPAILTTRGLPAAIESLTARAPVPTAVTAPERRYPPDVEAAAYFVVAEALANVAKHAHATRAEVAVRERGDGLLEVAVTDDGRGGAEPVPGRGLEGLADRVAVTGGHLAVVDRPGGGTVLTAILPVRPDGSRPAESGH